MSFGLEDRKALVTGASSGIGRAVAAALAEQGVAVAVHYNTGKDAAEQLAKEIRASGGTAMSVQADLAEDATAEALIEKVTAEFGGLDILINNAGAMGDRMPFAKGGSAQALRAFDLNCRSLLAVTHAALSLLQESDAAAVVNTGSIAGRNGGGVGAGYYAAAKGYVHTATRGMAKEFAPYGIRVNVVAPGVIDTPFHTTTPPEVMTAMKATIPMGRVGTAEDCVGAYLFLSSARLSGYITGQIIDVNGGQYMP